ncbi:MAG: hypothetical protein D6725_08950 [Planctomycetota bacterium]|nr:MAG: hypothetical protein D6725_08950 [Planctomycetota bacterium]
MSPVTVVSPEAIEQLRALYRRGLYLQAYEFATQFGPLDTWRGPARGWASRLARSLGAPRLARLYAWLGWREAPESPEVRQGYIYNVLDRSGPYHAWRELQRLGDLPGADAEERATWYAIHAQVLGVLRDFDRAETWLERAFETKRDDPWVYVAQANLLELQDRYEEAAAALEEGLRIQPWFRAAVQAKAHLWTLLGRDDEAVRLLHEGAQRLESCVLWGQLLSLSLELEQFGSCDEYLERFIAHAPLMERDKETLSWVAAVRFRLAYHRGDYRAAVEYARQANDRFYEAVADRMEACGFEGRYVRLPVGFVRQHHLTCAPATLSALSRYWGRDADHLEVAEQICYNGTSAYNERRWVASNGWMLREFTVTEDAAQTLIDRGVPFTFTTVEPGGGHLQAVIGYDSRRGLLVIRDPYQRGTGEALADKLLRRHAAFGPRGLAFVPKERRELLEGLSLPDAELWDRLHALDDALERHDREAARRCLEEMEQCAGGHRLCLEARRRLAGYDGNPQAMLAALDELAERYPENAAVQAGRMSLLRIQSRLEDRLATLRSLCTDRDSHPIFWIQYARELIQDARTHEEARRYLRRALRYWPTNARLLETLGRYLWERRRFDEACELLRFAACLEDKDESAADTYFLAACAVGRREEALAFLRRRFERYGHRAAGPARTLVLAHVRLSQMAESLQVLEEALKRRSEDGELLLFAAGHYLAVNDRERAQRCLEAAKGRVPQADWLRQAARFHRSLGELPQAVEAIRQALEIEPMAADLHRELAQMLVATEGREAAVAHFESAIGQFPHFLPLYQAYSEFLADAPAAQREAALRRYLELDSRNAWALRELGVALLDQHRLEDAREVLELAATIEPANSASHALLGEQALLSGDTAAARERFRQAVKLSVDDTFAVERLLSLCDTREQRVQELAFVREQLIEQVVSGGAVVTYWSLARTTLPRAELLEQLREALQARSDLWQLWCLVARQLLVLDRVDEAWEYVQSAAERFPLEARVWLHRADVCHARMDVEEQRRSLERALELEPTLISAVADLSFLLKLHGERERALAVVERAVCLDPTSETLRALRAVLLWESGRREEALQDMTQAVELDPGLEHGWATLAEWSIVLGKPRYAESIARKLTEARPGEARSWMVLARVIHERRVEDRLDALRRAEALSPHVVDVHVQRAQVLAEASRWQDALRACRPAAWPEDERPFALVHTEAFIRYQLGERAEAVELLHRALRDDPFHEDGWRLLAEWAVAMGDTELLQEAGESLYKLDPHDCANLTVLAWSLSKRGDRSGAMELLRRAVQLNPGHEGAAAMLSEMLIEDGRPEEAWDVLQRQLRAEPESSSTLRLAIEAAVRWRADVRQAVELFDRLCRVRSADETALVGAFQAFVTYGSKRRNRRAVRDMLESEWARERSLQASDAAGAAYEILKADVLDGSASPVAARLFGSLLFERERGRFAEFLPQLASLGEIGHEAVERFLADAGRRAPRWLRRMLWRERERMRAHPDLLAAVNFELAERFGSRFVTRYVGDWGELDGFPAQGLLFLALCRLNVGDASGAERILRAVGDGREGGNEAIRQTLSAVVDLLVHRDIDGAARRLETTSAEGLPFDVAIHHRLAQAVVDVYRPRESEVETAQTQRTALKTVEELAAVRGTSAVGCGAAARTLARHVLARLTQTAVQWRVRWAARWLLWRLRVCWPRFR